MDEFSKELDKISSETDQSHPSLVMRRLIQVIEQIVEECRRAIENADTRLKGEEAQIDQLYSELEKMGREAQGHLQKIEVPVPSAKAEPLWPSQERAANPKEKAREYTQKARKSRDRLVKFEKKEIDWYRIGCLGILGWGFFGSCVAGVIGVIIWGDDVRLSTIIALWLFITFIIPIGRGISKVGAKIKHKSDCRICYQELTQAIASAKAYLDPWRKQAQEDYEKEIKAIQDNFYPLFEKAHQLVAEFTTNTGLIGASWSEQAWYNWSPVSSPLAAARLGTLSIDGSDLEPLFSPLKMRFSLPALVPIVNGRSLLFQATGEAKKKAIKAIQSISLRLLATIPPGKLRFVFIDPVGLGENVALFMPLGDYDESLITSKAWTEPQHIEQRLSELTEHMETVIQKYLRTEFKSIEEYNQWAEEVAEPYRILVVIDFPVNFTESSARRLVSIAQNGPRCGVYTFVVMDTQQPLPYGFNPDDLARVSTTITWDGSRFVWGGALPLIKKRKTPWSS